MPAVAFWASVVLIAHTYLIYPILLYLLTAGRRTPRYAPMEELPEVAIVIAAYNEESVLRAKLENTLAIDYPADRLEVVVVSDASTDGTDRIAADFAGRGVRLHRMPERGGKTAAQNAGVELARGAYLVFSDANSMYAPDALKQLLAPFADPGIGCVCGELRYANTGEGGAGKGEGAYWRYEQFLKLRESMLSSTLGANGAIYALRRDCFEVLGSEIISDFIMPIRVWRQGYRVVYAPLAVATEVSPGNFADECRRRRRIVSRSLYGLWTERGVLNPAAHFLFAFQMASHKLLRWLAPLLLAAVLGLNLLLVGEGETYRVILALQAAFYGLALLGIALPEPLGRHWLFYIPAYFCATNWGALLGLLHFLGGRRHRVWQPLGRG